MKILIRFLAAFLLLLLVAATGGYFYVQQQAHIRNSPGPAPVIVDIPRGSGTKDVVRLLYSHNIIKNEMVTLAHVVLSGSRDRLQAGEYLFDAPMSASEVIEKIVSGKIHFHKFTVPEGLTIRQTAMKWQEQGFGSAEAFQIAAAESLGLIHDLDNEADSLEGYLFPETYSFPAHTTPGQAIGAMVARFHDVIGKLSRSLPPDQSPPNIHEAVILASIVESEAAHDDERATIASVYRNRLKKNMLLQCDTTVIYALEREGRYRGTLTLKDLKFNSNYNTYVNTGLPPGAIMNPGYESLAAAFQPASTKYLYFVRTADRHHTFSETLAAHKVAVAHYRLLQRR